MKRNKKRLGFRLRVQCVFLFLFPVFLAQATVLNEWNFYSDLPGKALSQATNSAGSIRFFPGNETGLRTDGIGSLICTNRDDGTSGMWTNGAILEATLTSPATTGVQYLRYDFSYDLSDTNSLNDSGALVGFGFFDGTSNKVAGVALKYDLGVNTNTPHRIINLTEITNTVGTAAVIAKINLTNQTLSVWYNLTGDTSSFSEENPATNVTVSLTSFNALRFQSTGDIQPVGSTDQVAVDLLRTADNWADILVGDPSDPPAFQIQVARQGMDVGDTNTVAVVIRNAGGIASNVTSAISYSGAAEAFNITSNITTETLWPGDLMTNTYTLVAKTNDTFIFTAKALIAGTEKASTNFNVVVGSLISYLSPPTITEVTNLFGGVANGRYEPGEILDIIVTSTNNGARDISNVVNSLSANTNYFSISNLTSSSYSSMPVGASTATTYRVTISPSATNGTYGFSVTNRAGSTVWPSDSFPLDVFNQGIPFVSPSSITIPVLPEAVVTNTEVIVTNSGNAALTFSITDNGAWETSYATSSGGSFVSTYAANAVALTDPDTNNIYIQAATEGVSASQTIGFGFPFYGAVYSNFYVTADGYIGLSNTTNVPARSLDRRVLPVSDTAPLIAPFWGTLKAPAGTVRVLRQYDYLLVSYVGVSKVSGGTNLQFQAALYTNGCIEFRYKNIDGLTSAYGTTNVTIGLQGSINSCTNLSLAPVNGTSVRLTPSQNPWVSYTPSQNVSVGPQSSQIITFIANAAGKTAGTSAVFNAQFNWSTGGSSLVAVTANVTTAAPIYSAVSSLSFTGSAGQVTSAPFVITNSGTGALTFSISNDASAVAGYISTNPAYSWIDISNIGTSITNLIDPDPNPYITPDDEGYIAIPIGFAFPFYGGSYTQLCASPNGVVRLDTVGRIQGNFNLAATTGVMPEQLIAPYWGDLVKDANAQLQYHATAERFVITWENFRQYGLLGGSNLTFQLILTPAGDITFQYKQLEGLPWPRTTMGLRDTTNHVRQVNILQTNDWSVTNYPYSGAVYTQYVNTVSNRAVQFQSAQLQTIRYTPPTGRVAPGGTAEITIIGDASALSPGAPANSVTTNATLTITHNADGSPTNLVVTFTATNSQETVFARASSAMADDSDGDGLTDDAERIAGSDPQDAGSVFAVDTVSGRVLSWPFAEGRIYTVWYTLNLMDDFERLEEASNLTTNSFTDTAHPDAPVIYYKVTVQ